MSQKLLIVGGFHEVIELALDCGHEVIGIIDPNADHTHRGIPVLGNDDDAPRILREHRDAAVVISPDAPSVRRALAARYVSCGASFATLVSPKAHVSPSASIAKGVLVQSMVNVSANVRLGAFVRVNTAANIMHDVAVDDYVSIAPNAVLLGRVRVGAESYIGANATLLPERSVGKRSVVGAGSVVTKDVPDGVTVVGSPARPVRS